MRPDQGMAMSEWTPLTKQELTYRLHQTGTRETQGLGQSVGRGDCFFFPAATTRGSGAVISGCNFCRRLSGMALPSLIAA